MGKSILFILNVIGLAMAVAVYQSDSKFIDSFPPTLFNYIPVSPTETLAIVNPGYAPCFGTTASCANVAPIPNALTLLSPALFPTASGTGAHMLRRVGEYLELSYINITPSIALATIDAYDTYKDILGWIGFGGVQLGGNSPFWLQPGSITILGNQDSGNPPVSSNMWNISSGDSFIDPISGTRTFRDYVCHYLNASICGTLFRSSPEDPGVFFSLYRIIIGVVDYGFILANLQSYVLVGGDITLISYTNLGSALACVRNPVYEPVAQSLYLSAFPVEQSCYKYTSKTSHIIPQDQCTPIVALPALYSLLSMTKDDALMTAMIDISANDVITVRLFSDPACSQYTAEETYLLGCTQSSFLWYIITNE